MRHDLNIKETFEEIKKVHKEKITIYKKIASIVLRTQNVNFWVLIAFLPTFVIARFIVYHFPNLFLEVKGVHIHHLTYGIFLLAIAGILAINFSSWRWKIANSLIYGVGLALAFDEFGMWIHLEDDYWVRQSYDAIIILVAILFNIVYLSFFWRRVVGLQKAFKKK